MARRSLQVEVQYIDKVKNAFDSLGLTQKVFAEARLQLSRSTVSNFLRGKSIDRGNFIRICTVLKLDWEEITGLQSVTKSGLDHVQTNPISDDHDNLDSAQPASISIDVDIDTLVTQLRQQVKADIESRCGTMRILDMSKPISLEDIYTKVNILEKISGYARKNIADLFDNCDLKNFNRFNFGAVTEKIPGKEAVRKYRTLLILGKPGAGKTTFLKHIVIQCNRGLFQGELVPFFITLKDFAEADHQPQLLSYLNSRQSLLGDPPQSTLEDPPQSPLERGRDSFLPQPKSRPLPKPHLLPQP